MTTSYCINAYKELYISNRPEKGSSKKVEAPALVRLGFATADYQCPLQTDKHSQTVCSRAVKQRRVT